VPLKKEAPPKFPIPWGLFVILILYALAVWGYIYKTYYQSPEYQAAVSYASALNLLGVDDGKKCSESKLRSALKHMLKAASLMPSEPWIVEHIERLRWRFDERKLTLSKDDARACELVSDMALKIKEGRQAILVRGVRDREWGPEQLLAGPEKIVWYSIPGGVLIILYWAYLRFASKGARDREREIDLKKQEAHIESLGEFRRVIKDEPKPSQIETSSAVRRVSRAPRRTNPVSTKTESDDEEMS
jgi:cbb3-type cytochrome oxidase subunit 3